MDGKVYCGDAMRLLSKLASESVDDVIIDSMWGTSCLYDWGIDPARGDADKHWAWHEPYYRECLRVLKPGGVLAWCQAHIHISHFDAWFGAHRVWMVIAWSFYNHFHPTSWMVQTKEGMPVEHPNNMLVKVDNKALNLLKKEHPCPRPLEEMLFLVDHLTRPGDLILDCFCGTGTTLVAALQRGRRWIGCDRSPDYCRVALRRIRRAKLAYRPPPLSAAL